MNFSDSELSLIAYACAEMAFKRMAQANDAESQHSDIGKEIAEANRSEAKIYFNIAQKCREPSQTTFANAVDKPPSSV